MSIMQPRGRTTSPGAPRSSESPRTGTLICLTGWPRPGLTDLPFRVKGLRTSLSQHTYTNFLLYWGHVYFSSHETIYVYV